MKGRAPWLTLLLSAAAFLAAVLSAAGRFGNPATTEPPDPTLLVITGNVGADEHAYDLQITTVVVADGVTSIGDRAFRDCMALMRIELPASLKVIGTAAFSGCDSLRIIVYAGTVADWEELRKEKNWSAGVPATEVVCTDGRTCICP